MKKQAIIRDSFYTTWKSMRNRCLSVANESFHYYGGRGIKVCNEWLSFRNFERDMKPSYKKGLSLDRINNNGNYCKENCRWATRKEQARNRRSNLNIKGKTLAEWQDILGINHDTLWKRYFVYGWSLNKTLSTPLLK
jgi:hypothetical protein